MCALPAYNRVVPTWNHSGFGARSFVKSYDTPLAFKANWAFLKFWRRCCRCYA